MKKRKIFLLGFVSVIVAAIAWLLSMHLYYQQQFDARVAELKAAGYPVSLDDLEEAYVLPEGAVNAADVYIEAFSQYQQPNEYEREWLPISGSYIWSADVPPFPAEVRRAMESYLGRNQKTLELLDKAAGIEHCFWPRRRNIFLSNDHLSNIKRTAQLLCERNLYLAQQGKHKELLDSIQSGIALSETLLKQPFLIDYLVNMSLRAMLADSLEQGMSTVEFKDDELHLLQTAFERFDNASHFSKTLIVERCNLIKGSDLPFKQRYESIGSRAMGPLPRVCYLLSPTELKDRMLCLGFSEQLIKSSMLPAYERQKAFRQIQRELDSYSEVHFHLNNFASITKVSEIDLRALGGLRCAETALAVERYRLKHGALPETLEGLRPEFMGDVPRDPFDGAVMRYVRDEAGYRVYTIGEDGVDNGGVSQEEMRKRNGGKNPQEYDWPFTVRNHRLYDNTDRM